MWRWEALKEDWTAGMGGGRGGLEDLPVCQAPFTDWVLSDRPMRKSGQLYFNNDNDNGTTDQSAFCLLGPVPAVVCA